MDGAKVARRLTVLALLFTGGAFAASLLVGRYPIDWAALADPASMDRRVFLTLRLPRACMGLAAGFGLGAAGSVYQTVLHNPLAAPDVIGVASGASVGAAAAILLGCGGALTALLAFGGGLLAVGAALAGAGLSRRRDILSIVLAGIAVNALAQAVLMLLKLAADPEKELAAIEFWTMGSLADMTPDKLAGALPWVAAGLAGLALLRRPVLLLGLTDDEARMLGVPVTGMRRAALALATLITGAVVSVTGLIAFVGLLAPHIAALLRRGGRAGLLLSGLTGAGLLLAADVLARSLAASEVPVSVVTSLLGAPFLFWLLCRKEAAHG